MLHTLGMVNEVDMDQVVGPESRRSSSYIKCQMMLQMLLNMLDKLILQVKVSVQSMWVWWVGK